MNEVKTFRTNELLRQARLQRGWSQQNLAERLDIATLTVNRWERGKQRPIAHYRLKLCALLGKSEAELGFMEEKTVSKSNKGEQPDNIPSGDIFFSTQPANLAESPSHLDETPRTDSSVAHITLSFICLYRMQPRYSKKEGSFS